MKMTRFIFLFLSIFLTLFSCENEDNTSHFSEFVKVTLRDVGHQLLLQNQDFTSVVKPVIEISKNKYQISFENELSIHPDSLVNTVRTSFEKAKMPQFYIVEVKQCEDHEVAYSYEMKQNIEKGIVPCGGRELKQGCYTISIRFTNLSKTNQDHTYLYIIFVILLLSLVFLYFKTKKKHLQDINDKDYASLGHFKFYPDQNKLIKEAQEISLSKKECEILELLVAQANQIVKREEITKKVWEDNGVVVGRSLDTYISKLRKKLKEDESISLINVHGVGYKLEIKK
ncbi:MAG: winged helix-turn-helix transcriptional regulator [Flavobacteriaceae bacterium]|nr:winged helix-turn-helix domain-containing protein [Bacteroidia bacterium]NNK82999.1 winged helix-turn-helix transcriptional regulator [Flavobacteriaceae bacterium]